MARRQRSILTMEGQPAKSKEDSILWMHPQFSIPPDMPMGSVILVCRTPSIYASNEVWVAFQSKMRQLSIEYPGHPVPAYFLGIVDQALAWRAALPEHLYFWDEAI